MKKDKHIIIGIYIQDRIKQAADIQKLLTEFGCNIRTRLGLHAAADNYCADYGIIILEMMGAEDEINHLFDKLSRIDGIDVQRMIFSHPPIP